MPRVGPKCYEDMDVTILGENQHNETTNVKYECSGGHRIFEQVSMAEAQNREVQDAERADKFDANYLNGVYAPEVENDWAFEFRLTGGGS